MGKKSEVIKKDVTLTIGVTGTFVADAYRKYTITRQIEYDAADLKEYEDEDELISEQFAEDFEREAEKRFRDEWESGEIQSPSDAELELDEIEAEIYD